MQWLYNRIFIFRTIAETRVKILVNGGAGVIGSAVVRDSKLTYAGNLESLTGINSSERYVLERADQLCHVFLMSTNLMQ